MKVFNDDEDFSNIAATSDELRSGSIRMAVY